MFLPNISIKRPVLAIVMTLTLVLFGIISFTKLSVREYPDIDSPIVSVDTIYRGASPSVIETEVTEPLEEELMSIEGIKTITSSSKEEISNISIEFKLEKDINVAAEDVRDRVARVRNKLPNDIEEPKVLKQDADARPIIWIALYSDQLSTLELTDFAMNNIIDQLQTVSGVSNIYLGGEKRYAMRIWLDNQKMAAHKITAFDVETAIKNNNVELPAGRIENDKVEFTVKTFGELHTEDEFENIVVKKTNTELVKLKDVAAIKVGAESERKFVEFNGKTAIALGVLKQSKANTLEVAHGVKEKIKQIQKNIPSTLHLTLAYDSSLFIEKSIEELIHTICIAFMLVVGVIFIFLKTVRATLIPSVAIPASLIAVFTIMYMFNYSINIFTLLALTLAIGLVVDDAIVVLENIFRHIELGESPIEAAINGTKEVGFAVLATTVSLIVVFIPVAFMPGTAGKIFHEFTLTLSGAVALSAFISLSLTPMMCSRILVTKKFSKKRLYKILDAGVNTLATIYRTILNKVIHQRLLVIGMGVTAVVVGILIFKLIPKEFMPTEDRGYLLTILQGPEGATLDYTKKSLYEAQKIIKTIPEITSTFAVLAFDSSGPGTVNSGIMFTRLKPWEQRHRKQQQITGELFPKLFSIPGAMVFAVNPPSTAQRGFGRPIEFILKGDNFEDLEKYSNAIIAKVSQTAPWIINIDSDLKLNKPQLAVDINRDKAASLGVSIRQISDTMQMLLASKEISTFKIGKRQYKVIVQLLPEYRRLPSQIDEIYVKGQENTIFQIGNFITVTETVAPKALNHYDRQRSVNIQGSLIPIKTLGSALDEMDKIAKEILPPNIEVAYGGESKEYKETTLEVYLTFLISVLVVYLVLSAQFESFIDSFTILLTVPLAVTGALLGLMITGLTFNIYSQVAFLLLVGLVTKNAILIVEYANQLRKTGLSIEEATLKSCEIRFRPVLMTAIATILGAVPLMFSFGAGAELRQPIGTVVVFGVGFSTILTFFIVPVVYIILAKLKEQFLKKYKEAL